MRKSKLVILSLSVLAVACSSSSTDSSAAAGSPPECATGSFIEGSDVVTCFPSGTLSIPLSTDAKGLLEPAMRTLGVDVKASAEYYVLPVSAAPDPNARALYKPRKGSPGRIALIELNEAFDKAVDDGALLLALIHEYGHVAQYLRGEPAGDELEAKFCVDTSAEACEGAVLDHLKKMESDADAFLVSAIQRWSPEVVANLEFDPWALVGAIESSPVGPAYPPTPERVAPIAAALTKAGIPRGSAKHSRKILDRLATLGAISQTAIDRQGGVPK